MSSSYNNSSLNSQGGCDQIKRKRGRPPKSESLQTSSSTDRYKKISRPIETQHNFADIEHAYGSKNIGSIRRSRRYKPPDPNREMIVIVSEDEAAVRLNIPQNELEEFKVCMNDLIDIDDMETHIPSQDKKDTVVPRFLEIPMSELPSNDDRKGDSHRHLRKKDIITSKSKNLPVSYQFAEYDADSDDETFLGSLSSTEISLSKTSKRAILTMQQFRQMIAILEREFQLAKELNPLVEESIQLEKICASYIEETSHALSWVNALVESLENDTNTSAPNKPTTNPVAGVNLRIDTSLVDRATPLPTPLVSVNSNNFGSSATPTPSSVQPEYNFYHRNPEEENYVPSLPTPDEIRSALQYSNVLEMLLDIYFQSEENIPIMIDGNVSNISHKNIEEVSAAKNVINQVIDYYVSKRSTMRYSPLRCYHDFMMENWSRNSYSIPLSHRDYKEENVLEEERVMLHLRKDFDKARLIVDRVRRRERMKRDLIRLSASSIPDRYNSEVATTDMADIIVVPPRFTLEYIPYNIPKETYKDNVNVQQDSAPIQNHIDAPNDHVVMPVTDVPETLQQTTGDGDLQIKKVDPIPEKAEVITTSRQSFGHKGINLSNSIWSADEDKLLLLGVASCGLGRWLEVREDFALNGRSSAQMNQRFFKLTKWRNASIQGESSSDKLEHPSDANADTNQTNTIENECETNKMQNNIATHSNYKFSRANLSPILVNLLDNFSEEEVWNRISLRYLLDSHHQERRSGRPVKHPIHIPIPREYKRKGYLNYEHLVYRRPSSPNFKLNSSNDKSSHHPQSFGDCMDVTSSSSVSCDGSEGYKSSANELASAGRFTRKSQVQTVSQSNSIQLLGRRKR